VNRRKQLKVLFIFVFIGTLPHFHQPFLLAQEVDANDFDFNKNGLIDPGNEQETFLKHAKSEYYREVDINPRDGIISEKEKESYEKKLQEQILDQSFDINFEREEKGAVSTDQANFIVVGPDKSRNKQNPNLGGLLIRSKYEDVSVLSDPKDFPEAEGAQFSFSSDLLNDNSTWQARGAIFRPFGPNDRGIPPTRKKPVLTGYKINPGITFDRVINSNNKESNVDNLSFNLGSEFEVAGGRAVDIQYLRTNAVYETDFDFDRDVVAFQTQWEPVKLNWGIGVRRNILGGNLEYRWRAILHAEVGTVLDAGNEEKAESDESFFRLGPKLQFEISPTSKLGPLDRFAINAEWNFLQALVGETKDYLELGLTYQLDEVGYTTLELNYRTGETGLTNQNIDAFTLGFGLKF